MTSPRNSRASGRAQASSDASELTEEAAARPTEEAAAKSAEETERSDALARDIGKLMISGFVAAGKYIRTHMRMRSVYVGLSSALGLAVAGGVLGQQYFPNVPTKSETYIGFKRSLNDLACSERPSDETVRKILDDPTKYSDIHEQTTRDLVVRGDEFSGIVKADEKTKKARVTGFRQAGSFFDAARNGKKGRAVWHLSADSKQNYFIGYELGEDCAVGGVVLLCPFVLVDSERTSEVTKDTHLRKHLQGKCLLPAPSQFAQQ